jgi:lipoprotein-releasing system ATP-binding protein
MNNAVIACTNLWRAFADGDRRIDVLQGVNLELQQGETMAIVGASGSGKSTLLHCLAGIDTISQGQIRIQNQDLAALNEAKRDALRNRTLGFVYQFHHLLGELSAVENVAIPLLIRGLDAKRAQQQATDWLTAVGLAERLTHRPAQLSGGERQRVAIARAFVGKPACVMADEPTGNLDADNAQLIIQMMLELAQREGTAIIIVTHDHSLAQQMDSVRLLVKGQLQSS